MKVLVLSDDHEVRQELRNLLLSAGCSEVVLPDGLAETLEGSATGSEPGMVILDGATRSRWEIEAVERLCRKDPDLRVVVLIETGAERVLPSRVAGQCRVEYTLKITFARSLRSFLHPEDP